MPKHSPANSTKTSMPSAFIWYHADALLAAQLSDWVHEISKKTGLEGRLLMRDEDGKTTFMEIYPDAGAAAIAGIEKIAATRDWFTQLESPRRAEIFSEISR